MSDKIEVFERICKLEDAWRKADREFKHAILELSDDDKRAYAEYRQYKTSGWVQE